MWGVAVNYVRTQSRNPAVGGEKTDPRGHQMLHRFCFSSSTAHASIRVHSFTFLWSFCPFHCRRDRTLLSLPVLSMIHNFFWFLDAVRKRYQGATDKVFNDQITAFFSTAGDPKRQRYLCQIEICSPSHFSISTIPHQRSRKRCINDAFKFKNLLTVTVFSAPMFVLTF
jgi:hypothetical protein